MASSVGLIQSHHNFETGNRVEDALLTANESAFRRVDVLAFYGIVELSGSVSSFGDRLLALQIAQRVPGVTIVVESLKVIYAERRLDLPTRVATFGISKRGEVAVNNDYISTAS